MSPVKIVLAIFLLWGAAVSAGHPAKGVSPETAQSWLDLGNLRYAKGKSQHPRQGGDRRKSLVASQHPYAIIVGCADSRVPPEILFDQGLGNLFVIRIAGNVIDDTALGSIEYAVEHLGVRLIYVLGHEKCGAVKATVDALKTGKYPDNHVLSIAKLIVPSVHTAKKRRGDLLVNAVAENVRQSARTLAASKPVLQQKVRTGKVEVHGGVYDLDTGRVARVW